MNRTVASRERGRMKRALEVPVGMIVSRERSGYQDSDWAREGIQKMSRY